GSLGRVIHLALRWLGARWADEQAAATWRMDRAQAGHGAMGDMGVHLVDLVRWTFGEFTRVTAHAGIAYPSRSAPGVNRPPDAEDYCTVLGELASGAQVTLTASRAAHGVNEHTLEAFGTRGAVSYRLRRERPRWWEGELRAGAAGALAPVTPRTPPPTVAGDGDPLDGTGRTLIAPLVARLLEGIKPGTAAARARRHGAGLRRRRLHQDVGWYAGRHGEFREIRYSVPLDRGTRHRGARAGGRPLPARRVRDTDPRAALHLRVCRDDVLGQVQAHGVAGRPPRSDDPRGRAPSGGRRSRPRRPRPPAARFLVHRQLVHLDEIILRAHGRRYDLTSQPTTPPASTTRTGGSQRAARTTAAAAASAAVTQSCTAERASV